MNRVVVLEPFRQLRDDSSGIRTRRDSDVITLEGPDEGFGHAVGLGALDRRRQGLEPDLPCEGPRLTRKTTGAVVRQPFDRSGQSIDAAEPGQRIGPVKPDRVFQDSGPSSGRLSRRKIIKLGLHRKITHQRQAYLGLNAVSGNGLLRLNLSCDGGTSSGAKRTHWMHRMCKHAAQGKRQDIAFRGQIGAIGLLLALLPGCASVRDRVAFDALADTPVVTAAGSDSQACPVANSTETAAIIPPCASQQAEAASGAAPENRQEVAQALGTKYVTASLTLPPSMRPGSSTPPADASLITGSIGISQSPTRSANAPAMSAPVRPAGPISLSDAVAHAVLTYPEIRAREAVLRESKAGIDVSRAAIMPNADLRLAYGGNYSGSFEGRALPYRTATTSVDNRFDGGLSLRLLLWDFGAASADISRARLLSDAESFRLREKIDEIAWRTSQTFVKVHEHRALLALVDETIASHQELLRIVMAQEKEGHGTSADVNRVRSRLTDISAIRADVSLNLLGAEDQFERLTRYQPRRLGPVPNYRTRLPANAELAMSKVLVANPRLAAMQANNRSIEKELEAQRAGNLPRIGFEFDTESKNFRTGMGGRTQMEGRGMVAMRFKLFDGGLAEAQERQIRARREGGEMQLLNEREQLEADIRQAYRAIESAIRKGNLLGEGVSSARRVRELYLEQFKAGRRTIFELLDGQMAFYTARRAQIESQFEVNKAVIDVLRLTGELTRVLAGGYHAPSGKQAVANRSTGKTGTTAPSPKR